MKTDKKTIIIPDFLIFLKQVGAEPDQSVTNIQLETKITYSHLHNMKKVLVDKGLITVGKENVKNVLNLTHKGKAVVGKAIELFALLDITKDNMSDYRRRGKIKHKVSVEEEKKEELETSITPEDFNKIKKENVEVENGRENDTTQ